MFVFNTSDVNHFPATITGAGTKPTTVAGKIGTAPQFTSSAGAGGGFEYANNNSFLLNHDASLSFWLYPTACDGYQTVFNKDAGDFVIRCDTANKIRMCVIGNTQLCSAEMPIVLNTWQMVTYTWIASTRNLTAYRNSTSFSSALKVDAPTTSTNTLRFGIQYDGTLSFGGKLDEVSWYNQTLNTTDLVELYNSGAGCQIGQTCYNGVPPQIFNNSILNTTFNMTSERLGCLAWNTTAYGECQTWSAKPTVNFNTVYGANCSLRTVNTLYNASFICPYTGGTTHNCRIDYGDILVSGSQNLYANCYGAKSDASYHDFGSLALPINFSIAGGGAGLISCIKSVSPGCAVSIENNCASVT